jgi:hypothetical protein
MLLAPKDTRIATATQPHRRGQTEQALAARTQAQRRRHDAPLNPHALASAPDFAMASSCAESAKEWVYTTDSSRSICCLMPGRGDDGRRPVLGGSMRRSGL